MSRAAAAALLLAACLCAPAQARRTYTPLAPEFPADAVWLNAQPLTLKAMRLRRVVVIAFFSTSNLNSVRALAALKAWNERYELDGLLVVGVHTPEFGFQKDPLLVRAALKRLGVRFPVLLDNERKYWEAMHAEGWPTLFLVDYKTHLIFDHLGEGGYSDFEGEIRAALNTAGFAVPEAPALFPDPKNVDCGDMTTDLSLGVRRGRTVSIERAPDARGLLVSARDGETAYAGRWDLEPDDLRLAQKNAEQSAYLRLIYRGSHAFAVLAPAEGKPGRFYVRQDQMWLHPGNAGKDVQFDDDGRSFVTARQAGLYHLCQNPDDRLHEMTLSPVLPGAAVYGFSFSDRCLAEDLPR